MNPELSRLALSLWCSTKRVEALPRVTVFPPSVRVDLVRTVESLRVEGI